MFVIKFIAWTFFLKMGIQITTLNFYLFFTFPYITFEYIFICRCKSTAMMQNSLQISKRQLKEMES